MAWLWQLAKAIDKDPAWTAWWQPSGIPTLELWPLGHPDDARHIERRGDVLHVTGHSAALYTYASRLDREGAGHDQGLVLTEEMKFIYQVLLEDMLLAVADHLALDRPPHHLAAP